MSDAFGFQEPRAQAVTDDEGESLGRVISRYWVLLKRFYWILIITSILCVAAAYLWTDRQPRIYQATSKLIFHEAKPNIFGKQIERVELIDPGGRWQFEQFWNTQREVLRSKWFADRVVKRQGLVDDPRFMSPPPPGVTRSPEDAMRQASSKLLAVSDVSLQRDSRVGLVRIQIDNAELATKIADGIAETYVEYIREFQSSGVNQLATWFDTYVSTKRNELDASRTELQEYQRDNNILSLSFEERQLLNNTELTAVSGQLREVKATLFAESALLNQIVTMEKKGADLRALADLVQNETLRRALNREAEIKEEIARLRPRYLDSHPDMQSAHEQLKVVQDHINEEIARIRAGVENRVAVTRQNQANLQEELARAKAEVAVLNEIGVEYGLLRDGTEDLKQHYDMVLNRSNELDINTLYESDIIQVLENADIPRSPISPKLPLNLAVGLMLGLAMGGGIMVLIDALDNTVKSDHDVTKYTSRPILGMLPAVDASTVKSLEVFGESALDTLTHTAPRSSFAEGIKSLRANLMFMAPDNPPKLLLMTSPGPSEGKTLTSVNMAIALAQSGLRTLIVDTDLRRPRVHKALGASNEVGLSSMITGDTTLEQAVKDTGIENLSILACGPIPPNPSELLQSDKFQKIVEEMKGSYDRILFDSPPLAAVADALVLSHTVDAVMLILKFGQTRQELLRRSIEQLEAIGAPFIGCVLNNISADSAGYGYAYYYRYRYEDDHVDEVKPPKKRGPKLAS